MSPDERADLKVAVKEAVREEMPIAIAELLSPMVRRSTATVFRHYRRSAIIGWLALAIAVGLLFHDVFHQASINTASNHRQDCILAGLIKTVRIGDHDRNRNTAYREALRILEAGGACPQFKHQNPPPVVPGYSGPH